MLDLSFSLTQANPSERTELVVDEVAILNSDCGEEPDLLDPAFDSDNNWFGATRGSPSQLRGTHTTGAPPLNGEGNRFLELRNGSDEASMSMETYLLVPESDEVGDPAVFFQATSPTESTIQLRRGQDELLDASVQTNSSWQELHACLPAEWAGRWFRFEVGLGPADSEDPARVFLDDFTLGTSALCPAD